jgi:tetratricopeptide (TPR) repeat protein
MSDNVTVAEPLFQEGLGHLRSREYHEAVKCFDKAIEIEKEPIYLCNKGLALCRLEKNNEAIECYGKAIEINPNLADAWKDVGLVLKDSGRYKEAVKCYGKAIEINPNLADAWLAKGLVLKDLGEHDEAVKCFDKAKECYDKNLRKGSKDVIDWYGKGHALTQLRKYDEAVKCFDKVKEIDSNLADAWLAKGLVLIQLEKDDEAIEQFNKAIGINPKSVDAWNQKGKALYHLERYEEAIECHDTVLKIKEYEDAYFFRGQSKCAIKDYTSALEDFDKVSDQFPFHDEKTTSIGHCYYELGFYEDAENHYREAIKSNPKIVRAYFHLAVLYANENKHDRAKKQLETCLNINRNFSEARDAIKRLEGRGEPDWYRWWFGDERKDNNKKTSKDNEMKKMKRFEFKPILGTIVMAFIAGIMITTVILAFSYPSTLAPSVVAALTFPMALMIGVLLLPSLKRFKAASIELEPNPFALTIEMMRSLHVMDKSHREVLFMQHKK